MKRVIMLALAVALAPPVAGQLYKYIDKEGKTVYSDQPPPNIDSKQLNIQSGRSTATPAAGATGKASYVEQDKALDKGRKETREKQEKADKAAQRAQETEQQCIVAKQAYQTYADGGRVHKYNEKGERVYLGDEELEAERIRTRREMDEACKKA